MVSSQKPSQDNISLAVSEGISHGTAPKTTTNLLSDPRVLHIPVFISNSVSFVFIQIDPILTQKKTNHPTK